MRKIRHIIFLKDVLILALTSFGGPQVHVALFVNHFVKKRAYLTEDELLELNALCQILPGPTSTQTITALGYRIGGANLAYLTLLVWMTPAVALMTAAGFGITYLPDLRITRFIQPMAVAFIIHSAYSIGTKVIKDRTGLGLMLVSALTAYVFQSPWICPIVLVLGGGVSAFNYHAHEKHLQKTPIQITWANFYLFIGVSVGSAILGHFTDSLPVRLFENFYRNGSLVFGGGQVLAPILFTEFVEFKHYLSREEFLSGLAMAQVVPGPVFSIASYIGTLSMRSWGVGGQLLGSVVASVGVFLPGTFMVFFVYKVWGYLKQFRAIRASLNGVNAASIGLTVSASFTLLQPVVFQGDWLGIVVVSLTIVLLQFSKVPPYLIILGGLLCGLL